MKLDDADADAIDLFEKNIGNRSWQTIGSLKKKKIENAIDKLSHLSTRLLPPSLSDALYLSVWPEKNRKKSIKVAQKLFHWKNKDFDTFTKITYECGRFGRSNCCQRL